CCHVSDVRVPPFLVRASQTPGDVAWLAANQARSASASATTNSSSSFGTTPSCRPSRTDDCHLGRPVPGLWPARASVHDRGPGLAVICPKGRAAGLEALEDGAGGQRAAGAHG